MGHGKRRAIDRRQFVQASSVAAAALALGATGCASSHPVAETGGTTTQFVAGTYQATALGKKSDITAREAIESQYSLDTVKDGDGNYTAPSADVILSYVRNQILLDAAEDEGITVSSKEMKQYAEDSIGTSDYKTMATQYGVSKDQAKQIVRQSATLQKLYKKKVGDSSASMPTAPTEPADGNEETASKDYADYIINLAGDEWDSAKGTWQDADSTYAKAFADDAFTVDSATYKQAMTAYYTAYQQYSSQASSASSKWTEYANGLYAKANISIYGLFA